MPKPRILILTVAHGEAHWRMATALEEALRQIRPGAAVRVVEALQHCAVWFRLYYNSYQIPLKHCRWLWRRIENLQHRSAATTPDWLYRRGAQRLFQFVKTFDPDVLVATEVGLCELAAIFKRESGARFRLVGLIPGVDADRPWAQPEVDLFPVTRGRVVEILEAASVPRSKILPCGMPINPAFCSLPDRDVIRNRLHIQPDIPLLLVLFGGTGFGKPRCILQELGKVRTPLQTVFITGKNQALESELRRLGHGSPRYRTLGWVDNMHEWMAAADLLLGKPGGSTVIEALACGLPLLAFDPLPGDEERACLWIEKQHIGHCLTRPEDIAPTLERLLNDPEEMRRLRANALALAQPRAAFDAAKAILNLVHSSTPVNHIDATHWLRQKVV